MKENYLISKSKYIVENRVDNYINLYLSRYYIDDKDLLFSPLKEVDSLFKSYIRLIQSWNRRINLVSTKSVENLWKNHILPSLRFFDVCPLPKETSCLDAGAGAGFPGIPIKILRPDIKLHLCEAQRNKALFLQETIEILHLEKAFVINDRVEKLTGSYDMIFSRAMGKPETIVPVLKKLLLTSGKLAIWTAKSAPISFPSLKTESFNLENAGKLLIFSELDIDNESKSL